MRGNINPQRTMLICESMDYFVPESHPIRIIKPIVDAELERLSPVFEEMYSSGGRPSIPPERLLKASLLMALFSVRSERMFCEQLSYNMLFRWFLDMEMADESFDASTFSKNRARLLDSGVAQRFFDGIVRQAARANLLSNEHFTVDGTLIEAWASLKSFKKKEGAPADDKPDDPGNPTVNFRGEKRKNVTHQSMTDPEAKLMRKGEGKEAKMSFMGHVLMENRTGLCVDIRVSEANGYAEPEEALSMVRRMKSRGVGIKTLGADKYYDTKDFIDTLLEEGVEPHVARNIKRKGGSKLYEEIARSAGYEISQRIRKRVEEIFGWMKTIGGLRKTRYKGIRRTGLYAWIAGSAYNLLRMAKLCGPEAAPTSG